MTSPKQTRPTSDPDVPSRPQDNHKQRFEQRKEEGKSTELGRDESCSSAADVSKSKSTLQAFATHQQRTEQDRHNNPGSASNNEGNHKSENNKVNLVVASAAAVDGGGVNTSTPEPTVSNIRQGSADGSVLGPGAFAQPGPGFNSNSGSESSLVDNESDPAVIAHEVSSLRDIDLEEAEPVDPTNLQDRSNSSRTVSNNSNQTIALGILSMVILVGVIVIVVVITTTSNKENETVMTVLTKPTVSSEGSADHNQLLREAYLEGILTATPTLSTAFLVDYSSNSTSHQQLAFDWILQDPHFDNYTAERIVQRYALATFFHSTGGKYWTSNSKWLSYDDHECDWFASDTFRLVGTKETATSPCNLDTSLYERLWLPKNNLTGPLPDEVHALTSLQSINFWMNRNLSGTISPRIQQLSGLKMFSIFNCGMDGTLPSEIGIPSHQQILYLAGNNFHGTLPNEIMHLASLEQLSMGWNQFSGSFPTLIGSLRTLSMIGVQGNRFTGELPTQLGLLSQIRIIYLSDNWRMNSSIPSELGLLNSFSAIHAQNCSLFGSLPTELGSNTNLKEVILAENNLSGAVPSQLGLLSSLRWLFLSSNPGLNGTIPDELWNLTKMELWDISGTEITGSIPDTFQDLPTYEDFMACGGRRYPC